MSATGKLARVLQRTQEKYVVFYLINFLLGSNFFNQSRIANGQYYEAHQAVRTIVARHIRTKSYNEAIQLLFSSAELLLKADQGGSGCDLVIYLVSTYELAEVPVDATSRARLLKLLSSINPEEPNLKKVSQVITAWSSKFGGSTPLGDPELHHVLGVKFAQADEAYEAEKHLLLGTKDSPAVLAKLLFEWYMESEEPEHAPLFLSRAVFGYLSVENIRDSLEVTSKYIELLKSSPRNGTDFNFEDLDNNTESISMSLELPLLNFLQLLVPTCQFRSAEMYKKLQVRYGNDISDIAAWSAPLAQIAQQYFGIAPQRSGNMLQDLLGSFMMPNQGGNRALGA